MLNTRGLPIFIMIFATDHSVGHKIMKDVFEGAERDLGIMVQAAKIREERERHAAIGQDSLFAAEEMDEWAINLPARA